MFKKIKIIFSALLALISFSLQATIYDDIQRKQAEDRKNLKLENQLQEQSMLRMKQQQNSQKKLKASSNQSENNNEPCINIKVIDISAQDLVANDKIDHITSKYQDQCLNVKRIDTLTQQLQRIYYDNGFITTKVGLKIPQTRLKEGVLDIGIAVGYVDEVDFKSEIDFISLSKWLLFGDLSNEPLDVNNINKRIDQINRLNSHEAKINIKPSDKTHHSNIVVNDTKKGYKAFSLSLDNSGSKSTGVEKMKLNVDFDNFLIPFSKWSLNYAFSTQSVQPPKDSNSYTLDVSIPFRDYLFNFGTSRSDYDTNQILTTGDVFYSFGETKTKMLSISKHLNKTNTQDNKIKLGLNFSDEVSYSKLREVTTKNEVASKKVSFLSLSYEHSFQFSDQSIVYLNPSFDKGIDEFNALDDDKSGLDAKAQFDLFKFYGYYLKPFSFNQNQFSLMTNWIMQVSEDELFSAQSFSIGGLTSVRGFKDQSVSAKSGFYVQNSLSVDLNQWLPLKEMDGRLVGSVFFDFGSVYSTSSKHESLSGAGFLINYQHSNLDIKLTIAKNLERTNLINEKRASYFSITFKF